MRPGRTRGERRLAIEPTGTNRSEGSPGDRSRPSHRPARPTRAPLDARPSWRTSRIARGAPRIDRVSRDPGSSGSRRALARGRPAWVERSRPHRPTCGYGHETRARNRARSPVPRCARPGNGAAFAPDRGSNRRRSMRPDEGPEAWAWGHDSRLWSVRRRRAASAGDVAAASRGRRGRRRDSARTSIARAARGDALSTGAECRRAWRAEAGCSALEACV